MQNNLAGAAEIACRKALPEDFGPACELLNRYHADRLSLEERRNGFISALFTPGQLQAMAEEVGVFVAVSEGAVLACLYCCDGASPLSPPPYRAMRGHFGEWAFRGRALSAWRSFAYVPVCIDAASRGRSLLGKLFATMLPEAGQRYEVGTAFIARENGRSLSAHIERLGMTKVGEFSHADQDYAALAFAVG